MAEQKKVFWNDIDKPISGLATDIEHDIQVQREAIPLIFTPGIMGSCLRIAGTDGTGSGKGLPNMRWNPSSKSWMIKYFSGESGAKRRAMLVGDKFNPSYLEPNNDSPVGDGFVAIQSDYLKFLKPLKNHDWGAIGKIFEFPVYAFAYNWTDSVENAGKKLADRIKEIIAEAKQIVGFCEKVILVSHSMGGLVTRSCSQLSGAAGSILGIFHGVQPATGAPAAYWRVKAGFEGLGPASRVLGNSGPTVTPVLGNIPGGLQLLPNKLHRTNGGVHQWLTVTTNGTAVLALPNQDPYTEIYRVKAVVKPAAGVNPSNNDYWGLIDPALLDPGHVPQKGGNDRDKMDAAALAHDPWSDYLAQLGVAESFHDRLGKQQHPHTFCLRGVGLKTSDVIELRVEQNWVRSDPYPKRGFRGFFTNAAGNKYQAVLQNKADDGDGTVNTSSAAALDKPGKQLPGDRAIKVEHQPAYEDSDVQDYAIEAIIAFCKVQFESRHGKIGDYPAPPPGHA